MSLYLVMACTPCPLPDAEVMLNNQPFKFGTHEHIVIFERAEVDALIVGIRDEC